MMVWRDSLTSGGTPLVQMDAWVKVRALHIAKVHGVDKRWMAKELVRQLRVLSSFRHYREITIWSGRDLFCQVTLLYLLSFFARQDLGSTVLSLVCPSETGTRRYPCIASIPGRALVRLQEERRQLTPVELRMARGGWKVYCSSDPGVINRALRSEMISILELDRLLYLHSQRYPDLRSGLGRIERTLLQAIADGVESREGLLRVLVKREAEYGWGSAQLDAELKNLHSGRRRLLCGRERLRLTPCGERVLLGHVDRIAQSGIDLWLGGAHLRSRRHWRWDPERKRIVTH